MGFQDLKLEIRYRSDRHDLPRDFFCPVLSKTVTYKRASGYFNTTSLLEASTGLYSMARRGNARIELICSPQLTEEDIRAINTGYKNRDEVFLTALNRGFIEPVGYYEEERLNLLANLIATGVLDIKLAFLQDENGISIYHEKIAIYIDENGDRIAISGSNNESGNAMNGNFESFYVFTSWGNEYRQTRIAEDDFDRMWEDRTDKIHVIPFPKVMLDKLRSYQKGPVGDDVDRIQYDFSEIEKPLSRFAIPEHIELRYYQKSAIAAWMKQDMKGIFSLCTGAGKTISALAAMSILGRRLEDRLAVFIVCPYIHLVSQWEEDVIDWGYDAIVTHTSPPDKKWQERLRRAVRRFKNEGKPFICLTTMDTFVSEKILPFVKTFADSENVLLIVDEAHNFGAKTVSEELPYNVKYRLGLSATIRRHMDKTGTKRLFDYFGEECITYDLADGIRDGVLVHYDYHPIFVYLDEDELQAYADLTSRLKFYIINEDGQTKLSPAGEQILFKRARLLAGARNKTPTLMECIEPYIEDNGILVYCGATTVTNEETWEEEKQIDLITDKLRTEYRMSVERFTAQEDLKTRQNIKKFFQTGQYQAITAIRCLDEGVNIPGIKTAFIMSSSRNPKEFIQRRGRLLRKSPGKEKAVIYDFITLPRDLNDVLPSDFENDRTIIIGELARMQEFARLADNEYEASKMMTDIMLAYEVYFDIEEEMKKMEGYYGNE